MSYYVDSINVFPAHGFVDKAGNVSLRAKRSNLNRCIPRDRHVAPLLAMTRIGFFNTPARWKPENQDWTPAFAGETLVRIAMLLVDHNSTSKDHCYNIYSHFMSVFGLIVAGGSSSRFGGEQPKQYREIHGMPLLAWTLSRFEKAKTIDSVVVVTAEEYLSYVSEEIVDRHQFVKVTKIVSGGASRQESVRCGLQAVPSSCEIVAIHDAARPLIRPADIDVLIREHIESKSDATILASPVTDTIKEVNEELIIRTVKRSTLVRAETPQVFAFKTICRLHDEESRRQNGEVATDDAHIAEVAGIEVKIVRSTGYNIKITTIDDLNIVESILQKEESE